MRPIRGKIFSRLSTTTRRSKVWPVDVAIDSGRVCKNFSEVHETVAELSYHNPHFDIFCRGQQSDYRQQDDSNRPSSLVASMFRGTHAEMKKLQQSFNEADEALLDAVKPGRAWNGRRALYAHRHARWALLQHYLIAPTPVLDMTRSARVAASFAVPADLDRPDGWQPADAFIFVFGMPYPTGNITVAPSDDVVMLNLRALLPSDARRPNWQEGFLACDFARPTYWGVPQPSQRHVLSHNWARRLVGKIRIPAEYASEEKFWKPESPLAKRLLLPKTGDACQRRLLSSGLSVDRYG